MPLCLESSSLASKRLYERVGFVQCGEMTYGDCKSEQDFTADETGRMLGGSFYIECLTINMLCINESQCSMDGTKYSNIPPYGLSKR